MRTAYLLNSKYLPTLELLLSYYQEKVKTNPELQSQVKKFKREIAFVKAQDNKPVDADTKPVDPEPSTSNIPILPNQTNLKKLPRHHLLTNLA